MEPGNTPLVELRNMAPAGTRLFAKLEWYNPTGSIKDRPAWFMFHDAKKNGLLTDGMPIIEATSGNTGIGLARVALINKHPAVICLPSRASNERKQLLRAYGAELIEVDGGPNDAIAHAKELVAQGHGHMCYQYGNPANPASHEFGTTIEIARDWPLEAPPTHLVASSSGRRLVVGRRTMGNRQRDRYRKGPRDHGARGPFRGHLERREHPRCPGGVEQARRHCRNPASRRWMEVPVRQPLGRRVVRIVGNVTVPGTVTLRRYMTLGIPNLA